MPGFTAAAPAGGELGRCGEPTAGRLGVVMPRPPGGVPATRPRPRPSGWRPGPWMKGQISSEMARQSAVADSSPSTANRPRLMRRRIT